MMLAAYLRLLPRPKKPRGRTMLWVCAGPDDGLFPTAAVAQSSRSPAHARILLKGAARGLGYVPSQGGTGAISARALSQAPPGLVTAGIPVSPGKHPVATGFQKWTSQFQADRYLHRLPQHDPLGRLSHHPIHNRARLWCADGRRVSCKAPSSRLTFLPEKTPPIYLLPTLARNSACRRFFPAGPLMRLIIVFCVCSRRLDQQGP